jgi:hypothetical protein
VEGGYRPTGDPEAHRSVTRGTLIVIRWTRRRTDVWRAIATATVSGDPKKARGRIPSIVRKMFADFPALRLSSPLNSRASGRSRPASREPPPGKLSPATIRLSAATSSPRSRRIAIVVS